MRIVILLCSIWHSDCELNVLSQTYLAGMISDKESMSTSCSTVYLVYRQT